MKKIITNFYFNKAEYLVDDAEGNKLLLIVNYYKGTYKTKVLKKKSDKIILLSNYSAELAREFLERKHQVNFAYKFK